MFIINLENFFYNQTLFSDVQFQVNNQVIDAHRIILSISSPKFRDLILKSQNPIQISSVSYDGLKAAIEICYKSHISVTESKITEFVISSIEFDIPHIKQQCEQYCVSYGKIQADNVFDMLDMSKQYDLKYIHQYCLWFISVHMNDMEDTTLQNKLSRNDYKYVMEHKWFPDQLKPERTKHCIIQ